MSTPIYTHLDQERAYTEVPSTERKFKAMPTETVWVFPNHFVVGLVACVTHAYSLLHG